MAEKFVLHNQIERNQLKLSNLADMIDYLVNWEYGNDPFGVQQTVLEMEWIEAMASLEELLQQRKNGMAEQQQLTKLLVELEVVKPIADRLNLTWYGEKPV